MSATELDRRLHLSVYQGDVQARVLRLLSGRGRKGRRLRPAVDRLTPLRSASALWQHFSRSVTLESLRQLGVDVYTMAFLGDVPIFFTVRPETTPVCRAALVEASRASATMMIDSLGHAPLDEVRTIDNCTSLETLRMMLEMGDEETRDETAYGARERPLSPASRPSAGRHGLWVAAFHFIAPLADCMAMILDLDRVDKQVPGMHASEDPYSFAYVHPRIAPPGDRLVRPLFGNERRDDAGRTSGAMRTMPQASAEYMGPLALQVHDMALKHADPANVPAISRLDRSEPFLVTFPSVADEADAEAVDELTSIKRKAKDAPPPAFVLDADLAAPLPYPEEQPFDIDALGAEPDIDALGAEDVSSEDEDDGDDVSFHTAAAATPARRDESLTVSPRVSLRERVAAIAANQ